MNKEERDFLKNIALKRRRESWGWTDVDNTSLFWLLDRADRADEYQKALEFYADDDNWDEDFTPTVWDDGAVDLGKRAKKALKAIE